MFCKTPLHGGNRAKEHVLRNSWLKKLNHQKTQIGVDNFSKHGHINSKAFAADQLQAGEVCESCNNGWMNFLDRKVEHIVLGLATNSFSVTSLNRQETRDLARWLLKTACTFIYTDSKGRRHIPNSILGQVRRHNFLPAGFFMFCALSTAPQKNVGAASVDMWPTESIPILSALPQSTRMKFGVQYDCLLLGFAWLKVPSPTFTALAGFHHTLLTSQAKAALLPASPEILDDELILPDGVAPTILNKFLLHVGTQ